MPYGPVVHLDNLVTDNDIQNYIQNVLDTAKIHADSKQSGSPDLYVFSGAKSSYMLKLDQIKGRKKTEEIPLEKLERIYTLEDWIVLPCIKDTLTITQDGRLLRYAESDSFVVSTQDVIFVYGDSIEVHSFEKDENIRGNLAKEHLTKRKIGIWEPLPLPSISEETKRIAESVGLEIVT